MKSFLRPKNVLLLLIFLCFESIRQVCATTQVKWTAAKNDPNDEAAKAPKSQKYWDKHKIQKPEYAKTDAEAFAERFMGGRDSLNNSQQQQSRLSGAGLILLLVAICVAGYYYNSYNEKIGGRGTRLEGNSSIFSQRRLSQEELQKARLARFAAPDISNFEAKDD